MIEAYGVKGMKSTSWRRKFVSVAALNAWVERNDAEVYGTRAVEEPRRARCSKCGSDGCGPVHCRFEGAKQ